MGYQNTKCLYCGVDVAKCNNKVCTVGITKDVRRFFEILNAWKFCLIFESFRRISKPLSMLTMHWGERSPKVWKPKELPDHSLLPLIWWNSNGTMNSPPGLNFGLSNVLMVRITWFSINLKEVNLKTSQLGHDKDRVIASGVDGYVGQNRYDGWKSGYDATRDYAKFVQVSKTEPILRKQKWFFKIISPSRIGLVKSKIGLHPTPPHIHQRQRKLVITPR